MTTRTPPTVALDPALRLTVADGSRRAVVQLDADGARDLATALRAFAGRAKPVAQVPHPEKKR